jgi:hypothetical protein
VSRTTKQHAEVVALRLPLDTGVVELKKPVGVGVTEKYRMFSLDSNESLKWNIYQPVLVHN